MLNLVRKAERETPSFSVITRLLELLSGAARPPIQCGGKIVRIARLANKRFMETKLCDKRMERRDVITDP